MPPEQEDDFKLYCYILSPNLLRGYTTNDDEKAVKLGKFLSYIGYIYRVIKDESIENYSEENPKYTFLLENYIVKMGRKSEIEDEVRKYMDKIKEQLE